MHLTVLYNKSIAFTYTCLTYNILQNFVYLPIFYSMFEGLLNIEVYLSAIVQI